MTLLYLQPRCLSPAARGRRGPLPAGTASPAVDWARPPVPTELISVLISHTGSVQQEQESSPRAKSLPVCKCPEAQELGPLRRPGLATGPQRQQWHHLYVVLWCGRWWNRTAPRAECGLPRALRSLLVTEPESQRWLSQPREPRLRAEPAGSPCPALSPFPARHGGAQRSSFTRIPLLGPGNKFYCCFFAGKITEILSHNLVALVGPGLQ